MLKKLLLGSLKQENRVGAYVKKKSIFPSVKARLLL